MSWQKFTLQTLSVCLLSALTLTSVTSGVYVHAQSSYSNTGQNEITRKENLFTTPLRIWLNQKHYTYNNTTRRWELNTQLSSKTYQETYCSTILGYGEGDGVRGIADYRDGISETVRRKIQTATNLSDKVNYENGAILSKTRYRNCYTQNVLAGNTEEINFITPIRSPKNSNDLQAFYAKLTGLEQNGSSVSQVPVYTYHYQFVYKFPEERKAELSNFYRKQTGVQENEEYDGVVWTYTYYTYLDRKTRQYKPWTNPELDNENGGFLIYPYYRLSDPVCGGNGCSGPQASSDVVTTQYTPTYAPDQKVTVSYNLKEKKLRFQGIVPVGSSGCWSLGNQYNFLVKPYSDGQYGIFKFNYQVKNSGAQICTAQMMMQLVDYTQDMSSLSKEAEDFVIKTLRENKFTQSNVESYEGSIPPLY